LDPLEKTDLLLDRIEAGELVQRRKHTQVAEHRHGSLLSDWPATPNVHLAIPPATPESHEQPIPDRGYLGLIAVGSENPMRLTGGTRGYHLETPVTREAGPIELFLQDGFRQKGELLQHRFVVEVAQLHSGPGESFLVIRNLPGSRGQTVKPARTKLPETRRRAPLLSPAAQGSVVQVPEIGY